MDYTAIGPKWQAKWREADLFATPIDVKNSYYTLAMFPYPSSPKMHMGHVRNYSIVDADARFHRMRGRDVLCPMGFDSFGLPAENAAIKTGADPAETTKNNIAGIKEQFELLGCSFDWSRELATSNPAYYKWNQWLFLKMYEKGLIYRKNAWVNWDPVEQSVLANEQVVNGKGWRSGAVVEKRQIPQWFMKITDYADELLNDLELLPHWPERVKTMQRNWIGRSEGARVEFELYAGEKLLTTLSVFTTRPDTIYGVSFIAIAPEHEIIQSCREYLADSSRVDEFVSNVLSQSTADRVNSEHESEGVDLGLLVKHPLTGKLLPVWAADYVLMDYGTGAVMSVPAHDQRDFDFAQKYSLPILPVVKPQEGQVSYDEAFTGHGVLINSDSFTGLFTHEAQKRIVEHLEERGVGEEAVTYRLRDWLISRQRYWGTPIPMMYDEKGNVHPVPFDELPVLLPKDVTFGKGNPLATSEKFVHIVRDGVSYRRETDTMDTFFDSSWYFLRFTDPHNSELPFSLDHANKWMAVDQYTGGIEHAILHLLYARFFTKVLRDLNMVDIDEPFTRLLCQGMVLLDGDKMSKSRGNVVDPGEIIDSFGPDTARVFVLFAAHAERDFEWSDEGVNGVFRFLNRVESLFEPKEFRDEFVGDDRYIRSVTHRTVEFVTEELERMRFSAAVSSLMQLQNELQQYSVLPVHKSTWQECTEILLKLLAPFAPHVAEELWHRTHNSFVSAQKWPLPDPEAIDLAAEQSRMIIDETISDIEEILGMLNLESVSHITLWTAAAWKYDFVELLRSELERTHSPKEIITKMMKTPLRKQGSEIPKLVARYLKDRSKIPRVLLSPENELAVLRESSEVFKSRFGAEVEILSADNSSEPKSRHALPGKPAIQVQ